MDWSVNAKCGLVERLDALQESLTSPDVERRLKDLEKKVAGIATLKPEERQGLRETINDLLSETQSLRADSNKQSRTIEGLQATPKDQSEQLGLLRDGIVRLQNEVASCIQFQGRIAEDLARGLQRIKAMEEKNKPQKTDATLAHINALASELLTRAKAGQRGVTYAEAAKILKLDKSRICQLRGLIASDSRFNIDWHPNRKNTKVICLKNYKIKEIDELNVQ
jgi:chromosome segregation ATPase